MRSVSLDEPKFDYDDSDPDGYRAGLYRVGPLLGATMSGASLYELPPGQKLCPYHFEYTEEEWVLGLAGTATVRTPEGEFPLEPMRLVFFPAGPDGAHQLRNDSDTETVRLLMWSNVANPAITEYPDSGKVGVHAGERSLMVRRESAVGYYDGEA